VPNASATVFGVMKTSTGLTATAGVVTVNTSQNIATLSNLTTNGSVQTSGGVGTLSVIANTGSGSNVLGTAPTIAGGSITALTAFGIRSTGAAFDLTIASAEVFTAGRTLSITMGDAARTLTLSGNPTLADWFDQSVKTTATPAFATTQIGSSSKQIYMRTLTGVNRIDSYDNPITVTVPLNVNASLLTFQIADTTKMTLDASGNLGIGVSPGAKLHVNGAIWGGADGVTAGFIKLWGASATNDGNVYNDATYGVRLDTNSNARPIRIDGSYLYVSGNVGIGTSTLFAKLTAFGVLRAATADGTGVVSVGDLTGTSVFCGMWRGDVNVLTTGNYLNLGGYAGIMFSTGAAVIGSQTERMRIDTSGNVGIGTAPSAKLHIATTVEALRVSGDNAYLALYNTALVVDYTLPPKVRAPSS
jgi:hypothetical protein